MAQSIIQTVPREYARLGDVGALINNQIPVAKIPTYYFDITTHCLPLTEAQFNASFTGEIPIFDVSRPPNNRQTNAAASSGVNIPFLAVAAGVVALGEGEAFSMHGVSVARPAAPTSTPVFILDSTCVGGCGMARLTGEQVFAQLWWGGPTWKFIEKFFRQYRLQFKVGRRFLLVDESTQDVGMVPLPAEFVGASDSLIAAQNFIRAVNDTMRTNGIGQMFLTPNLGGSQEPFPAIAPLLPQVTYGHPRVIGLGNRIYCFNQALLFLPGMQWDTSFVQEANTLCYDEMRTVSTIQCVTQDERVTDSVLGNAHTQVCTIPGGSISLGLVVKGFDLWPQACVQYIADYMGHNRKYIDMVTESGGLPYLEGVLRGARPDGVFGKLAGIFNKHKRAASED